jgi:hypothetical protein
MLSKIAGDILVGTLLMLWTTVTLLPLAAAAVYCVLNGIQVHPAAAWAAVIGYTVFSFVGVIVLPLRIAMKHAGRKPAPGS